MKMARPSMKTFLRPYLSLNRPAGMSSAPKKRAYAFSTQATSERDMVQVRPDGVQRDVDDE